MGGESLIMKIMNWYVQNEVKAKETKFQEADKMNWETEWEIGWCISKWAIRGFQIERVKTNYAKSL